MVGINENLQTMFDYKIMLEWGIPLAIQCAVSTQTILDNFTHCKLQLTVYWDGKRNNFDQFR